MGEDRWRYRRGGGEVKNGSFLHTLFTFCLTSCPASRFQLDPAVNLEDLVERCPAHMTGADLYALCSDAMTAAVKRKISLISEGRSSLSLTPVSPDGWLACLVDRV